MSEFGLSEEDVAYQMAHINDDRRASFIASTAVLTVLSTIAVALRGLVRWRTVAGLGADDYWIFLAWVSSCKRLRTERKPTDGDGDVDSLLVGFRGGLLSYAGSALGGDDGPNGGLIEHQRRATASAGTCWR